MIRVLLPLAAGLMLAFAGLVGLIHTQPYDDRALREFVTPPEGCAMPCFMGIQPGITTVQDAVDKLWAHDWVDQVRETTGTSGRRTVVWTWSGTQPALVKSDVRGFFIAYDNIVRDVRVPTRVPLHQVMLLYGPADWGYLFVGFAGSQETLFYQLVFQDRRVSVHFRMEQFDLNVCQQARWSVDAELSFVASPPRRADRGYYDPCFRTTLHFSL